MTEPLQRDPRSLIAPLGFILLGILALSGTRDMSPLGSVFPRTMASVMITFSAMDIVWRWLRPRPAEPPLAGSAVRRLLLVAIVLLWALLLQTIGFFVTSLGASLLLLLVANYDRWTIARTVSYIAGTLAVVGGLYSVFAFGLKVPLPKGILF